MQGSGSIPGEGAKSPHAAGPKQPKQAIKWKQYCNKFNKHLKNGPQQQKDHKNQFLKNIDFILFDPQTTCSTGISVL